MYRVVIIDDNKNTVEFLKCGIPWESLELEVIGTAYDGRQGKQLIMEKQPEIIITDIQMPDMDGLTMLDEVLASCPESKVIVITGYDNIQYATHAIRLSVFDYILKPIEDHELLTVLKWAVNVIHKEKHKKQASEIQKKKGLLASKLATALLLSQENTLMEIMQEKTVRWCEMLVLSPEKGVTQGFLEGIEEISELWVYDPCMFVAKEQLIILFFSDNDSKEWQTGMGNTFQKLREQGICGKIERSGSCRTDRSMREIYAEAVKQEEMQTFRKITGLQGESNDTGKSNAAVRISVADMQQAAIQLAKLTVGPENYEEILRTFKSCTDGSAISLQIMTIMYYTQVLQLHENWKRELEPLLLQGGCQINMELFCDWLKQFLTAAGKFRSVRYSGKNLVEQVLQYIRYSDMDSVRLDQVAEQFCISPNYLSSLIRKETGMTFQQHVQQNKVDVSKQLLDNSRMTVEEIAHTVGYENYISFYQLFKRMEGMTPSEYRFRKRDEE